MGSPFSSSVKIRRSVELWNFTCRTMRLTIVLDDFHLGSAQVVLIAEPSRILVGVEHDQLRIAVDLDAPDVLGLMGNLAEQNGWKI